MPLMQKIVKSFALWTAGIIAALALAGSFFAPPPLLIKVMEEIKLPQEKKKGEGILDAVVEKAKTVGNMLVRTGTDVWDEGVVEAAEKQGYRVVIGRAESWGVKWILDFWVWIHSPHEAHFWALLFAWPLLAAFLTILILLTGWGKWEWGAIAVAPLGVINARLLLAWMEWQCPNELWVPAIFSALVVLGFAWKVVPAAFRHTVAITTRTTSATTSAPTATFCSECSAPLPEDATFCSECSAPI